MPEGGAQFQAVMAAIDDANADDPRREVVGGASRPQELVYAERMSDCLDRLYPDASEALKIAARAQHIRRWEIPRDSHPVGRAGYNAWRTACRDHHAGLAAAIMRRHGYDEDAIAQVAKLIRKQELKRDPESQALQNVVGTVFIAHYLADFAEQHDDEKLVGILRKTARKMSAEGLAAVQALPLPPRIAHLIEQALG